MPNNHFFNAHVEWSLNPSEERKNKKSHEIFLEGKPSLKVSAAKAFKGNPDFYNPEDLLLSSLVSCHMMSYLYVCEKNNVVVLKYSDSAEATLEVHPDGSGYFTEVRLYPKVQIANQEQEKLALSLHAEARKLCFIANSCNFSILHFPSCEVV